MVHDIRGITPGPLGGDRARDGLRDAALLGAGVAVIGGTFWWGWNRSRPLRRDAPGRPGNVPHWNFASKDGVGTALGPGGRADSRVWFTLRQGAFTEIFYPRADRPAVRGWGLIVTDGRGLCSDERRDASHEARMAVEGVPTFELVNTCRLGRYRIEKTILAHPRLDVVLQFTRFVPLAGKPGDYRLFTLLEPQVADQGSHNTAWVGEHKGMPMLFAERASNALALACSAPWADANAGYIGRSDGLRDLERHGRLVRTYERAEDGNVALVGEVDLVASGGVFVQALGFGSSPSEAGHRARAALLDDLEAVREEYARGWRDWQASLDPKDLVDGGGRDLFRTSAMVLRSHEDKGFAGAVVASLSTPWGQARSDEKVGPVGYHVVWPRDLVEVAGGLLAVGARPDALRVLRYLRATQNADGHWPQNQLVDGSRVWDSIQMGETALPVLLVDLLLREGSLPAEDLGRYWPMVRSAVAYILRAGPASQEDRWEDSRGFTPYTLSALIAPLQVASEMADARGEHGVATYLRESADAWNENIEFWTYVEGTELARRVGVRGNDIPIASQVRLTMVQRPALNTTQFGWVRSRLPRKARPVPPIFQPEVAAEAVVYASEHDRREIRVGWPTVEAIVGNFIAPGLLDWYLGRTCYEAQQTDEPEDPGRPDNLWEPVPGDHGAHGPFGDRSRSWSWELWADTHRGWLALAGGGLACLALAAVAKGGRR